MQDLLSIQFGCPETPSVCNFDGFFLSAIPFDNFTGMPNKQPREVTFPSLCSLLCLWCELPLYLCYLCTCCVVCLVLLYCVDIIMISLFSSWVLLFFFVLIIMLSVSVCVFFHFFCFVLSWVSGFLGFIMSSFVASG